MRKILSLLAALALLCACQNGPKTTISGTITGAADSTLCVEWMASDGIQQLDQQKLGQDGHFRFTIPAKDTPEFYVLRIGNKRIYLATDSAASITLTANLDSMATAYQISGCPLSEQIRDISLSQQLMQKRIRGILDNDALLPGDMKDSVENLVNAYKEVMKRIYIYPHAGSAAGYYAVAQTLSDGYDNYQLFNPNAEYDDALAYDTVARAWAERWPDLQLTKQLQNTAKKGIKLTKPFNLSDLTKDSEKIHETGLIDITLPDSKNHFHSLSELKGKVVLLDFTMYEAPESQRRTYAMRTVYKKYHDRGLEIYQISLDQDAHFWKTASEPLPWICVHETDGTATNLYMVQKLPTYFLINRDNEVVKRSDDVTDLEREIENLL